MNGIQGKKPAGRQWNIILDAVVTILEYKKSTIDRVIYIKVITDGTVSYLTVSTDDVINTINNDTAFPELTIVFKEQFEMKLQEGSVLKYLNFRIFQSPLGFSVDQTDHTMELVNEWFPTGKFRKVDTTFRTDSTYEKEYTDLLPLTGHSLHKKEMEYNGKIGYTLVRIQHIDLMSRIDIFYETSRLYTQTIAPTLPGFQGIKRRVQYLASHPHKCIFYPSNYYDG